MNEAEYEELWTPRENSLVVGIFGEQFEKKAVLTRERWRLKKLYLYGKFFARGGGRPFAQKIIASAQIFTKESKRNEDHIATT